MITEAILDVTRIAPKLKHPTIFKHFDELEPGEAFVILNDHDPKPLYYQLLGERGNIFTWDYLEEGPQWWRVQIAKRGADSNGETVGAIAAKDYRKAEVFKKMGIDFCCGGNKTLEEASREAGVSEEQVQLALEQAAVAPASPSQDFNKWDLDFLADYIVNTHHRYVKDNVEIIAGLASKVAQHHGDNHPELPGLAANIHRFLQEMLHHMTKEENVLFPNIKQLVAKKENPEAGITLQPGFVRMAVKMMQMEHEISGEDLKYFRKITGDYALPPDACNSYTYLFEKMKEFENDLFQHIHLENNILFPKAVEMDVVG